LVEINQERLDRIALSIKKIEEYSLSVDSAMNNVAVVSQQNAVEVEKVNEYTKDMESQLNVVEFMARTLSSMATSEKKMLAKNNKIIWKRYPNYRQDVRDYMKKQTQIEDKFIGGRLGWLKRRLKLIK